MMRSLRLLVLGLAIWCAGPVRAEVTELRISKGFGIHFLPLYVAEHERLVEKHAAAAGLGDVKVAWPVIDGGNNINDAMLSGALDIAAIGVPGFLILWDKARGNARFELLGLTAVGAGSLYLNARNPNIRTLADVTAQDRIAVPGIKTSYAAIILQMAAAKAFGTENFAKLDPLTVGLSHPDALIAMVSGNSAITGHVASPPFSYLELDNPAIHRVFSSVELFGSMTVIMSCTTRRFHDANPRLVKAVVEAVDEAAAFIARDRRAAAVIYRELAKVKAADEQIVRILDDPDTRYSIVPEGVMRYADFMHAVGTLRARPDSWKSLFFPEVAGLPGS